MANFQYFDKRYIGGLSGGSKLDKELFNRFVDHPDELQSIAVEIRKIASDKGLRIKIEKIEADDTAVIDEVWEGQALYKLHKVIERDRKVVKRKKESVLSRHGKLACEVCNIVFEEFYGEIGRGFIECHHRTPLGSLKSETKTRLEDLALVCSNCHRMLHRRIDCFTVEGLRAIIIKL
jgi:5-methylcytosine-specific restriction protein A